jgi:hypothetical protein
LGYILGETRLVANATCELNKDMIKKLDIDVGRTKLLNQSSFLLLRKYFQEKFSPLKFAAPIFMLRG